MVQRPIVFTAAATCWIAVACVSPPSHFSVHSAASADAPAAPTATVAIALREEPPLPGGATEGWSGLAVGAGASGHMHHHGMHMEGMDMSGMDMSGMQGMDMPDAGPSATPAPAPTDAMPAMPGMQGMKHAH